MRGSDGEPEPMRMSLTFRIWVLTLFLQMRTRPRRSQSAKQAGSTPVNHPNKASPQQYLNRCNALTLPYCILIVRAAG